MGRNSSRANCKSDFAIIQGLTQEDFRGNREAKPLNHLRDFHPLSRPPNP
jgi:hypothetical protein